MDAIVSLQSHTAAFQGLPAAVVGAARPPLVVREIPAQGGTQTHTQTGSQAEANLSNRQFGALRSRQDDLNSLAAAIRGGQSDVDVQDPEVRKLFPPYPPGQEDRMAFLDQLSGLRAQIERLIPPAAANDADVEFAQARAEQFALQLSEIGGQQLAQASRAQGISQTRQTLEAMVETPHQIDPVQ